MDAYIRGAMFQYPNPEVIRIWASYGDVNPTERRAKFREQLDKAGITSCHLYDLMQPSK